MGPCVCCPGVCLACTFPWQVQPPFCMPHCTPTPSLQTAHSPHATLHVHMLCVSVCTLPSLAHTALPLLLLPQQGHQVGCRVLASASGQQERCASCLLHAAMTGQQGCCCSCTLVGYRQGQHVFLLLRFQTASECVPLCECVSWTVELWCSCTPVLDCAWGVWSAVLGSVEGPFQAHPSQIARGSFPGISDKHLFDYTSPAGVLGAVMPTSRLEPVGIKTRADCSRRQPYEGCGDTAMLPFWGPGCCCWGRDQAHTCVVGLWWVMRAWQADTDWPQALLSDFDAQGVDRLRCRCPEHGFASSQGAASRAWVHGKLRCSCLGCIADMCCCVHPGT
jgi:hypothetical protein